jgi:hypothetical protein
MNAGVPVTIVSQDEPALPAHLKPFVVDDSALETSYAYGIETVPTLLRVDDGRVTGQVVGWSKDEWQALTGIPALGVQLPASRPGCSSRSLDPDCRDALLVRFEGHRLSSRRIDVGGLEDVMEATFDRGWSDGLPVVPPTIPRVIRMLAGTSRKPDEVIAEVPPDLAPCTIEKAAINAVLAGCLPEYFPVVISAIEAACADEFGLHGLLSSTYFSGPIVIVNGPVRQKIRMNSGINALGPGNRANATIGRALQLVLWNVGGAKPGAIDRSTLGYPGKFTFCFPENEEDSPWEPLSVSRGFPAGASTVTLFAGHGISSVVDRLSTTPESLARSLAANLRSLGHPKLVAMFDAVIVLAPEHAAVFSEFGWSKQDAVAEIHANLNLAGADLVYGAQEMEEGLPHLFADFDKHIAIDHQDFDVRRVADASLPKLRHGGLHLVHAGGNAGRHSAVLEGWLSGPAGSQLVTREVEM